MEVYSRKEKRRVMRQVQPANEKLHWSVVERLGRDAIVDEKVRRSYAPPNLPSKWNIHRWRWKQTVDQEGPRVATETRREAELIQLCRNRANERYKDCALFRDLSRQELDRASILYTSATFLSPQRRRDSRLRRLRKNWAIGMLKVFESAAQQ